MVRLRRRSEAEGKFEGNDMMTTPKEKNVTSDQLAHVINQSIKRDLERVSPLRQYYREMIKCRENDDRP